MGTRRVPWWDTAQLLGSSNADTRVWACMHLCDVCIAPSPGLNVCAQRHVWTGRGAVRAVLPVQRSRGEVPPLPTSTSSHAARIPCLSYSRRRCVQERVHMLTSLKAGVVPRAFLSAFPVQSQLISNLMQVRPGRRYWGRRPLQRCPCATGRNAGVVLLWADCHRPTPPCRLRAQ